jgi:hypothetical protein
MSWELKLVENMGEILGSDKSESVVVPTEELIEDMKKQLKFLPKNFTWIVGWRTYVWEETEKKEFKELTQEQHKTLSVEELSINRRWWRKRYSKRNYPK